MPEISAKRPCDWWLRLVVLSSIWRAISRFQVRFELGTVEFNQKG